MRNHLVRPRASARPLLAIATAAVSAAALLGCVPDPTPPIDTSTTTTEVTDPARIVINEVESDDPDGPDWIELHNLGSESADLTGYGIKDDVDERPDVLDVTIEAGGYVVLTQGVEFDFGLGSADSARVFLPDGTTLVDSVSWPVHAAVTLGRCPDPLGALTPNATATPGAANDCTPPDPDPDPDPTAAIRITEWMYSGGGGEFIELTNVSDEPIDMTDWSYDDSAATPGAFVLSGLGTVAAGESVVLTEADPETFRADWGLCAGISLIGPYTNNLGRADQINIFAPDGTVVDILTYGDNVIAGSPRTQNTSAWPQAAGLGANDATLWTLSTIGDAEGSSTSGTGDVGSPGSSTRATVVFDPCATPI